MHRPAAVTLLLIVVTGGCLGWQTTGTTDATIDPDDPPFRIVVDGDARYTYEVVWPDGNTTERFSGGSVNITVPGNYTLRVADDNGTVAVHEFRIHHYELAGCNQDYLRVAGTTLAGRTHTEIQCTDESDVVSRPSIGGA